MIDGSQPEHPRENPLRLARAISRWLNPQYYSPLVFCLTALASSRTVQHALGYTLITVLIVVLPTYSVISVGVRTGRYRNIHVPERERRNELYVLAVACVIVCFVVLALLQAPRELLATMLAVLLNGLTGMLVNRVWKISIHTGGISGAVTVLGHLFWPYALAAAPLVPLVGWSRMVVGEHSLGQVVAGGLAAFAITMLAFEISV